LNAIKQLGLGLLLVSLLVGCKDVGDEANYVTGTAMEKCVSKAHKGSIKQLWYVPKECKSKLTLIKEADALGYTMQTGNDLYLSKEGLNYVSTNSH